MRHAAARERVERGIGERARDLARPVGAEVHEHDDIAVGHRRGLASRIENGSRLDELVGLAAGVRGGECCRRVGSGVRRVTVDEKLVGRRDALPALVPVHGVVAAADRGDARAAEFRANGAKEGERRAGAFGRRIAAVEKGVDEDARRPGGSGQLDHRGNLALVTVDASGRSQSQQVDGAAGRLRGGYGRSEDGIAREFSRRDGLIDARVVLIDDAAGPDVEMPDFGIAHLACRQADFELGRVDRRMRARGEEPIPVWHPGSGNRIVRRVRAAAEAIEDQQDNRAGNGLDGGDHGDVGGGSDVAARALCGSRAAHRVVYAIILPLSPSDPGAQCRSCKTTGC